MMADIRNGVKKRRLFRILETESAEILTGSPVRINTPAGETESLLEYLVQENALNEGDILRLQRLVSRNTTLMRAYVEGARNALKGLEKTAGSVGVAYSRSGEKTGFDLPNVSQGRKV